jgi:TorA maturation chaperone TorD
MNTSRGAVGDPTHAATDQVSDAPLPDLDTATMAAAFELLAHWWSRPLPDELDTWLRTGDVAQQVSGQMGTVGLEWDTGDRLALLDEYERLFVGPGPVPCPPYESFWRGDVDIELRYGLMGPCTATLRRVYEHLGLELRPSAGELPDHLPIELEALAYALSLADSIEAARSLFFDHVQKWLPWFCRAVAREAGHPFYRDLARLTNDWLPVLEHQLADVIDTTAVD